MVSERLRGQGIGRLLCRRAEQWSWDHGVRTVRVTSRSSRVEAHRFYREGGYGEIKTSVVFEKIEARLIARQNKGPGTLPALPVPFATAYSYCCWGAGVAGRLRRRRRSWLPEAPVSAAAAALRPPASSCRSSRLLAGRCVLLFLLRSDRHSNRAQPIASGGPRPRPASGACGVIASLCCCAVALGCFGCLARSLKRVFFRAAALRLQRIRRLVRRVRRLLLPRPHPPSGSQASRAASSSGPCRSESFPSCPASAGPARSC